MKPDVLVVRPGGHRAGPGVRYVSPWKCHCAYGVCLALHSATRAAVLAHRALCSGHFSVHHLWSYGLIQRQILA